MKKSILAYLLSTVAFNNPSWKMDDQGHIVLKDGNPVYLDASGREMTVDQNTIASRNAEAKANRERAEAAEAKLKLFGDLDPEVARKAVETVGKLDAKKLIDAGEVDKVRKEISDQFTKQIGEKDTENKALQSRIENMLIDNVFSKSEFVRDSVAVPLDMFQASMRGNFKVENGEVVAYDKAGNRLMSKSKAGEYATADEALEILVEAHPQKDTILRAPSASGSGSKGQGGAKGGGRVMKRADFEALNPTQQGETAAKIRTGEMKLVD